MGVAFFNNILYIIFELYALIYAKNVFYITLINNKYTFFCIRYYNIFLL